MICCNLLESYSTLNCSEHVDPEECSDVLIIKYKNGWGIPIRDGGSSYSAISFCPWCGTKLAEINDEII